MKPAYNLGSTQLINLRRIVLPESGLHAKGSTYVLEKKKVYFYRNKKSEEKYERNRIMQRSAKEMKCTEKHERKSARSSNINRGEDCIRSRQKS